MVPAETHRVRVMAESVNEDQANGQNSGQSGTVEEGGEDDGRDK